jgi:hypothetical protein
MLIPVGKRPLPLYSMFLGVPPHIFRTIQTQGDSIADPIHTHIMLIYFVTLTLLVSKSSSWRCYPTTPYFTSVKQTLLFSPLLLLLLLLLLLPVSCDGEHDREGGFCCLLLLLFFSFPLYTTSHMINCRLLPISVTNSSTSRNWEQFSQAD